ncbi:pilin [Lysobacter sp. SG-8]|uniref:Pilin n=1 Tax=Marilutibacter penaei TaxID=2759900 RepID=A0A7W3U2K3_9GAMM|nr:pilin [Lysobacter penaei]MBB1087742.1 pilin [Lysobacter penaei]
MIQWYTHDPSRGRSGPLDVDALREAWARGEVDGSTLAWRDGMPGWRPLAEFAIELGLPARTVPPPLPGTALPTSPAAPPPKKLSGCAITAIVAACAALFLVPILAIIAAVALPAYQDYVHRAHVAEALSTVTPLKVMVVEHWQDQGACPDAATPGFGDLEPYRGAQVAGIELDGTRKDTCVIELVFGAPADGEDGDLAGETLQLRLLPEARNEWECAGGSLPDKYRPAQCRGGHLAVPPDDNFSKHKE